MSDENAIRDTIHAWLEATRRGDSAALAAMLDDDVLFVIPDRPPFGKKEFFAGVQGAPFRFESRVEILELVVHGDWALTRVSLQIEIVPVRDAPGLRLAGPTMSVWRKDPAGRWLIWRDANMVRPVSM